MAIEFKWHMSEEQYDRLRDAVVDHIGDPLTDDIYFGSVSFGLYCVDFNHTLDNEKYTEGQYHFTENWYGYSSGYETGDEYQNSDSPFYATALEGTPQKFNYEESMAFDNLHVDDAVRSAKDFESFKAYIEAEIVEILSNSKNASVKKAEAPDTYWAREYERSNENV